MHLVVFSSSESLKLHIYSGTVVSQTTITISSVEPTALDTIPVQARVPPPVAPVILTPFNPETTVQDGQPLKMEVNTQHANNIL